MEDEAQEWIRDNANANTRKAYQSYQRRWRAWLSENEVAEADVAEAHVVCYMKALVEEGLAVNTINKVALSAIADLYRFSSEKAPTVGKWVEAARKVVAKLGKAPVQKKPLQRWMLVKMAELAEHKAVSQAMAARDMFLVVLLMAAMLRESEAVNLRMEDVWEDTIDMKDGKQQEVLFVFVQQSKTDQERRGHTVVVAKASDPRICPVGWYRLWCALRSKTAPYLFHRQNSDEKLAVSTPCGRVKFMLEKIGVDSSEYGSHSGRSGGATAATAAGVELRLTKKHGGWKSDAVFAYIRDDTAELVQVSAAILNGK